MRIYKSSEPDFRAYWRKLVSRGIDLPSEVEERTLKIISRVRAGGDDALWELTWELDKVKLDSNSSQVSSEEISQAYKSLPPEDLSALKFAASRIERYHQRQVTSSWFITEEEGVSLGQLIQPLGKVGVYVPGGKASYPSSVLMGAVPAKVAGVPHIVICTPPGPQGRLHPAVLAAADIAGVNQIYKVGGAQAIAAMAYGTQTIPRVDKIVGPGNLYVTAAKRLLFGQVDIDMLAGPSELVVVADETAKPEFVGADLLSQAEHDQEATVLLLTTSQNLATKVETSLEAQLKTLSRADITRQALDLHGTIIITQTLEEALELASEFAPEHLELAVAEPYRWLKLVRHAGAVLLGHYTPTTLGDYLAGPNHVLPTGGSAKFFSPLGVYDFLRRTSFIDYNAAALKSQGPIAARLADLEGLSAHAQAIRVRGSR